MTGALTPVVLLADFPDVGSCMLSFRRSIFFSLIDRYAALVFNLSMTAVLARLLMPADFGIFTVSVGVIAMIEAVREFSVGAYLIQAREVNPRRVRTAVTVTFLLSAVMAGLTLAAAAPLTSFYDDPRLKTCLQVATIGFLFVPFSGPTLSLLRRDMQFDRIALVNVCSAVVQLLASVGLALRGFGYLSLVLGAAAYSCTLAAGSMLLGPGLWIFRPCTAGWRSILSFGGWASATNILNMFSALLPQLCLGRLLGLEAAGLFNRAALVCQTQDRLVLSVMRPVLLPALAARARSDQSLKQVYLRGVDLGVTVQWPFLVCLVLLADPIVTVLLGAQWAAAAPVVRLLAVGYGFLFAAFLTYPTLVAVGRVRDTLTADVQKGELTRIVAPAQNELFIPGECYDGLRYARAALKIL